MVPTATAMRAAWERNSYTTKAGFWGSGADGG